MCLLLQPAREHRAAELGEENDQGENNDLVTRDITRYASVALPYSWLQVCGRIHRGGTEDRGQSQVQRHNIQDSEATESTKQIRSRTGGGGS